MSVLSCTPGTPTPDTGQVDTDPAPSDWQCDHLGQCFAHTEVRLVQSCYPATGTGLDAHGGRLVVSAPNATEICLDGGMSSLIVAFEVDLSQTTIAQDDVQMFADVIFPGQNPHVPTRMGASTQALGDVTGDGAVDIMVFSDAAHPVVPSFALFPGPFEPPVANGEVELFDPTVYTSHVEATHGARCGDLTGDGVDDIVLDTRIVFGPLQPPGQEDFAPDHVLSGPVYPIERRTEPGCVITTPDGLRLLRGATSSTLDTEAIPTAPGTVAAAHFRQDTDGLTAVTARDAGTGWEVWIHRANNDPVAVSVVGRPDAVLLVDLDQDGTDQLLVSSSDQLGVYDGLTGDPLGTWSTGDGVVAPGYRMLHADVSGDGRPELVIADPFGPSNRTGRVFVLPLPLAPP